VALVRPELGAGKYGCATGVMASASGTGAEAWRQPFAGLSWPCPNPNVAQAVARISGSGPRGGPYALRNPVRERGEICYAVWAWHGQDLYVGFGSRRIASVLIRRTAINARARVSERMLARQHRSKFAYR
jgi:hypothetical protein